MYENAQYKGATHWVDGYVHSIDVSIQDIHNSTVRTSTELSLNAEKKFKCSSISIGLSFDYII